MYSENIEITISQTLKVKRIKVDYKTKDQLSSYGCQKTVKTRKIFEKDRYFLRNTSDVGSDKRSI